MSNANDVLQLIDQITGEVVTYRENNTWYDGTPLSDSLIDGVIFKKKSGKYYKRQLDEKTVLKISTIADLRNTNAYYEGQEVILLGYYNKGDKKELVYKFTVQNFNTLVDDGGSIIKTSRGSWIAQFEGVINLLDFGGITDYNPETKLGTDNTPTVVKMISVPSKIYEFPEGDILMNTQVKFPNGVVVRGKGAIKTRIYRGTSIGSSTGVIYQLSSSDAEILEGNTYEDMSFYGQVTETNHNNFTHLLSVAGVKNATVRNCHFYGFKADGILISSGPANGNRRRNQNILIENCYFNGLVKNNRNGVSVIMCDDITIKDCYFENIGAPTLTQSVGAIDVERNSITDQQTNNVRILNNVFKDITTTNTAGVALFCFGDNTSSAMPSSKNHEIRGNRFINCYWGVNTPEAKLDFSNNVTPTGVNIDSNFFIQNVKGIQLFGNSNVNITNNHFYGNNADGKYSNIELWADRVVKNINIINNYFYNTGRNASIDITSADGLVISGNSCSSNRPFIQQSVDSVSNGNSRVLNSIKIFRNRFEGLGTAQLRMYQVASGANNARLIMNNSSCEMYDNEVIGNAVLSNIVTSTYNRMVYNSHITAAMMTGTWKAGDFVEAKLDNYNYRIKCSVSGTTAFTDVMTCSATNGSNVLTVTAAITTQLRKGMFILIGDDTVVKEIIDVFDNTVVIRTNYTGTTNPTASINSSPPQFISEPLTNFVRITGTNTNLGIGKGEETLVFTGNGTAASIITTDANGFPNAIKRYRNNKTGNLTVTANTGISLNGVVGGSVVVEPSKTLTILLTAVDTWITLEYANNATATLIGGVKQSTAVTDVVAVDSTSVTIANVPTITMADATTPETTQNLVNEVKGKVNLLIDLANDIKAKYNINSTLSNSNKSKINAKLAADRLSGQQL